MSILKTNNKKKPFSSFHKLKNFLSTKKTRIKFLRQDNSALSPTEIEHFAEDRTSFEKNFSPLKDFSYSTFGKLKGRNSQNKTYVRVMHSKQFSVWREMSPGSEKDSPDRIRFNPKFSKKEAQSVKKKLSFGVDSNSEDFTFSVSMTEIKRNIPRPITQTKVMKDISARQYLSIFGAEIIHQTQEKVKFHWAHRRAWSLSGKQSKENLDAATAASNFDTLFKVETPLKILLESQLTDKVIVSGTVHFLNKTQRVAKLVVYHLKWGKGKECTIEIDPMSIRFPTQDEADAAIYMMEKESKLSL